MREYSRESQRFVIRPYTATTTTEKTSVANTEQATISAIGGVFSNGLSSAGGSCLLPEAITSNSAIVPCRVVTTLLTRFSEGKNWLLDWRMRAGWLAGGLAGWRAGWLAGGLAE
ncbi:hypothetical protein DPMN_115618 [Dreissena polymorpha]|uniref:Uncharacterized protein n=1 Tax=Dreissena polymorpha TaxID=45954 RepID=A0A9D4QTX8_DREPO|nr:hypothetical protein DPMN_115618 [Dreissena polymorpha]